MRPTGSPICGAMFTRLTVVGAIVEVGPVPVEFDDVGGAEVLVDPASRSLNCLSSLVCALASCRPVPQSWKATNSRISTPAAMRALPTIPTMRSALTTAHHAGPTRRFPHVAASERPARTGIVPLGRFPGPPVA